MALIKPGVHYLPSTKEKQTRQVTDDLVIIVKLLAARELKRESFPSGIRNKSKQRVNIGLPVVAGK